MTGRLTLRIVVFLTGATLMALEVAAFRIIGKTFGTALRETTTVIAVFMAAMSIGYWGGGRVGDRWPSRRTLAAIVLLAAAGMVVIPALDRILSPRIAASTASLSLHALIVTTALFFVPTVFLSSVSPVAIRLFAAEAAHSGRTAGSISALSTIGSIAGTIASAFVLLDWLKSIDRIVLVLAATAFLTTILVLIEDVLGKLALAAGCAIAAAVGVYAAACGGGGALRDSGLLFVQDSPYHHVMVRNHATFRTLKFDWLTTQTSMSVRDPAGPGLDYADYAHIAKLLNPSARTMLVIGLGGGTVVKQFGRLHPEMELDAVELDPVVVNVAKRFFSVAPSDRLRIHTMDGRVFLRHSGPRQWDVIYVDTYTTNRYGSTIPPHLVTREFFEELKRHLTPRGMLAFHLYAQSRAPMARALHRTLAATFPTVLPFAGSQFTEFFALTTTDVPTKTELLARAAPLPWRELRPIVATLDERSLSTTEDPILTDDYAPVDTLLRRR